MQRTACLAPADVDRSQSTRIPRSQNVPCESEIFHLTIITSIYLRQRPHQIVGWGLWFMAVLQLNCAGFNPRSSPAYTAAREARLKAQHWITWNSSAALSSSTAQTVTLTSAQRQRRSFTSAGNFKCPMYNMQGQPNVIFSQLWHVVFTDFTFSLDIFDMNSQHIWHVVFTDLTCYDPTLFIKQY